jgi:hypothetical protein
MTRGASGGRDPSNRGGEWRTVTDRDNGHFHVTAGQSPVNLGQNGRPQQDSNLRSRLRRPLLSPLSYGGCATPKSTSHKPQENTSWAARTGPQARSRQAGPRERVRVNHYLVGNRKHYPHAIDILPSLKGIPTRSYAVGRSTG